MNANKFLLDNETEVTLSQLIEANQDDPLTENEIHELMCMSVNEVCWLNTTHVKRID